MPPHTGASHTSPWCPTRMLGPGEPQDHLAMATSIQQSHIRVDFSTHGNWRIDLDDVSIACETLEAARRIACREAVRRRPCEVLVRDAYHRVIEREHIES